MKTEEIVKWKRGKGWRQKVVTTIVTRTIRGQKMRDTYIFYGPALRNKEVTT